MMTTISSSPPLRTFYEIYEELSANVIDGTGSIPTSPPSTPISTREQRRIEIRKTMRAERGIPVTKHLEGDIPSTCESTSQDEKAGESCQGSSQVIIFSETSGSSIELTPNILEDLTPSPLTPPTGRQRPSPSHSEESISDITSEDLFSDIAHKESIQVSQSTEQPRQSPTHSEEYISDMACEELFSDIEQEESIQVSESPEEPRQSPRPQQFQSEYWDMCYEPRPSPLKRKRSASSTKETKKKKENSSSSENEI